jgi:4-carboxymuconolactone decarboxylase
MGIIRCAVASLVLHRRDAPDTRAAIRAGDPSAAAAVPFDPSPDRPYILWRCVAPLDPLEVATMSDLHRDVTYDAALNTAAELLDTRLEPDVAPGPGEPTNAGDFTRLATVQTFGDAWSRTDVLDVRTRALVSVTIAATLGTLEPLRGQLRIALHSGVTAEEIVEASSHRSLCRRSTRFRQLPNRPRGVRRT